MRSKPKKPNNKGLVAAALIALAVLWLVMGTVLLLGVRYWLDNNTLADGEVQEALDDTTDASESEDPDDPDDVDGYEAPDSSEDPDDHDDDDDFNDPDEDPDDDFDDPDDDDPDDDDLDDDGDDDDDDGSETFTVDAWDGFAAVRTGRGTNFNEVGRLSNGEKIKVTDLENGWYKIASGKWKGYYLHKSSLK